MGAKETGGVTARIGSSLVCFILKHKMIFTNEIKTGASEQQPIC